MYESHGSAGNSSLDALPGGSGTMDPSGGIFSFRPRVLRVFTYAAMAAGWGMTAYALLTGGTFLAFSISVGVVGALSFLLIVLKQEQAAAILLLCMLTVLIGYRSVSIRSTLNASLFSVTLLVAAFITTPAFATVLFSLQMAFIVVCSFLGVFTWTQQQDPATGLYFANTVTTLVPLLIIVYLVAFLVSKVLIGAMEKEAKQTQLLKKAQERLIAEARLASARILAGGIAHDFNNILVSLLGNLDLLKEELSPTDPRRAFVDEALSASNRARELTRQLLMLSKGNPAGKSLASLSPLIRDTARMTLSGSRSRAEFDLAEDLWPVEADLTQISQLIQNLALNASEAMPRGGVVTFRASNQMLEKEQSIDLPPGPYVVISVQDEGEGIPAENLQHIFDPFFSTKEGGTGLGLSICYSVASNHHGRIDVASTPGERTTFTVRLPARPGARVLPREMQETQELPNQARRVLVMDDDQGVQKLLRQMLERLGFQADVVFDGREAERAFTAALERSEPYAFVIMDLTIPGGVGGEEALALLRRLDPKVRAIVSSGYSSQLVAGSYQAKGFRAVLSKPYTLAELSRAVEAAFGPDPNGAG
jgi:signal transduction histidine kinase/ActR/RegA family two-component response regulator